jgi:hypothetical protein
MTQQQQEIDTNTYTQSWDNNPDWEYVENIGSIYQYEVYHDTKYEIWWLGSREDWCPFQSSEELEKAVRAEDPDMDSEDYTIWYDDTV